MQRAVRRVEIGRDQLLLFVRRRTLLQRWMGGEPRGISGIEFELELNLFCLARRVTGKRLTPLRCDSMRLMPLKLARDTCDTWRDRTNILLSQSS